MIAGTGARAIQKQTADTAARWSALLTLSLRWICIALKVPRERHALKRTVRCQVPTICTVESPWEIGDRDLTKHGLWPGRSALETLSLR